MTEKNQNEIEKNKMVEHWQNKMESKFDVDIDNDVKVEEDENKEETMECTICNSLYVVDKSKECIVNDNFICAECVGKIVQDFVIDKIKED